MSRLTAAAQAFSAAYQGAFDETLDQIVSGSIDRREGRNVARAILAEWQEKLEALEEHLDADPIIAGTFRMAQLPRLQEELAYVVETGQRIDWGAAE